MVALRTVRLLALAAQYSTIEAVTLLIKQVILMSYRLSFSVNPSDLSSRFQELHDRSPHNNDGPGKQARLLRNTASGHQS